METTFRLRLALRLHERLIGLIAGDVLGDADALLLAPCHSIHSFGMSGDIDIAFIDRKGRVMKSQRNLPPGRFAACRGAWATIERFSDDTKSWFQVGQQLEVVQKAREQESIDKRNEWRYQNEDMPLLQGQ